MKRLLRISTFLVLSLGINACNIDDEVAFRFVLLKIVRVDLPESFELNRQYQITVEYSRMDDCTVFEGFDVVQEGTTVRKVYLIGSTIEGRECNTISEEATASFNFEVLYDEDYLFRFWQGVDDSGQEQYLEVQVPVN